MSSFEPDPPFIERDFRPVRLGAGESFVAARSGRVGHAEQPSAAETCTPEQHAALEQAAFDKGLASAEADWARCERACDAFEAAAAELARQAPRMLRANRDQMVALAAELARLWIGAELRLDAARFEGPLDRALALCRDEPAATVRLHPEVLAALERALPERVATWSDAMEVALVADVTLEAEAFRIESPTRTIDSGLEALAIALRRAVEGAFEAPAAEPTPC
ncbi:MAG: FliH/SctL family protein [Myxococcota bacterium]